MRSIRTAAAAVLVTFATMQVGAQQPGSSGATTGSPAAQTTAPNAGTINGNALTSSNGQSSGTTVRLRDAQTGRNVATQVTDKTGSFTFGSVDPGTYVVEVLGPNQSVLASSPVLTLHAGEIISTAVKLPFIASTGILGQVTTTATIVAAGAAAAGVLAVQALGDPTCPQ